MELPFILLDITECFQIVVISGQDIENTRKLYDMGLADERIKRGFFWRLMMI